MAAARPQPVRIDDYRNPRFSPEVRAIRDAVIPMAAAIRLEADPLLDEATSAVGLTDFGADPRFPERLDVLLHGLREEAELAPFGVVSNHGLVTGLLKSRLLLRDLIAHHPEILEIPIRAPIFIVGLPRTGHDPPPQPDLRRSRAAFTALLGEPRTGPGSRRSAPAGRARSAGRAHADGRRPRRRRAAALLSHARDDRRARARGDPAAGHRLLVDVVRDDRAHAVVARLLPAPRPDPALRVPQDGPAVADLASGRRTVGAEVTAAQRAARPAAERLPRCRLRGHAPRPGRGHCLRRHDDRLQRADERRAPGSDGHRPILVESRRGPAARLRARSRSRRAEPLDRRALPRVHAGRPRDGRAHLRRRRATFDRGRAGRDGRVRDDAPTRSPRHGGLRPHRLRARSRRASRRARVLLPNDSGPGPNADPSGRRSSCFRLRPAPGATESRTARSPGRPPPARAAA